MTGTLIETARALTEVLARESAALAAMDLAGAAAMLDDKRAAAAAFEAAQARPTPPADAPALREAAARLGEAAEENRRLLEQGLRVQARVVGIVARAARPKAPVLRYGARGALTRGADAPVIVSARV